MPICVPFMFPSRPPVASCLRPDWPVAFVSQEGTIKEGTPAAAEMSKADVTKRQR